MPAEYSVSINPPAIHRIRAGEQANNRARRRSADLAAELGKSRDGVSLWYRRGAARRREDAEFAAAAEDIDQAARKAP
jgi:hypothetical protein